MMIQAIKILLLILILFPACQRGKETRYIPLSKADKSFVTYTELDEIPFIHSNGFEFKLIVESKTISTAQSETKHPRDNYSTYEVLKCRLTSVEPELNILMNLLPKDFRPELSFRINSESFYHAGLYLDTETLADMDSIVLNNETYFDVFLIEKPVYDSLIIMPLAILYTKDEGIIKINMSNNETFTINR